MSILAEPELDERLRLEESPASPASWRNDTVNLMRYAARVFRTYFGYSRERADALMMAVHERGHAVVAEGPREQMELHAQAMHGYALWATVRMVGE